MIRIKIEDLPVLEELNQAEMVEVIGGSGPGTTNTIGLPGSQGTF
jgi:hypothetical protein